MSANIRCFVAMAFDRPDTDAVFAVVRRTLKPLGIVPRRVYFEAGYAQRQIPVVYTARRDHFREKDDGSTISARLVDFENTLDQRFRSR